MNPLQQIRMLGQRVWLDNLSSTLLAEGVLQRLIEQDGLAGVTSNPTIFVKAISESAHYREGLQRLRRTDSDPERRYEALVIADIRSACDLFRPVYDGSREDDGYVSLEVSPALAYDEAGTVAAVKRLTATVERDNLLIKIPATPEGIRAFERLISEGYSINVTLMFSLHHVLQVAEAYIRGLRNWTHSGGDPRKVKAVASLLLSRVDTLVDRKLEAIATAEAMILRGRTAIALARLAYQRYRDLFHGTHFADLRKLNARPQRLLWASTGTKNPAYSDVLYVEPLIGPETVNTMTEATLTAFREHGRVGLSLEDFVQAAEEHFIALEHMGIDLKAAGEQLQSEGLEGFSESFTRLLDLVR